MAETLGPLTALGAVNEMLYSIGETSIASITGTISPSATTALALLYAASRDLQEEGWHFNTEKDVSIALDGSGYIQIPADALRVDNDGSINVSWRNGKMWNIDDNTFVFTEAMDVTLVRHLLWTELPQYARRYIAAIATMRLQATYPPPAEYAQVASANHADAKRTFMRAENDTADFNMLTDSLSVSTILRRGS